MTANIAERSARTGSGFLLPTLRRPLVQPRRLGAGSDGYFERSRNRVFSIGLFVPVSGALGLWGPSTIACAQLAAEEINQGGGLLGREVRLKLVDAADESPDLVDRAEQLLEDGQIDAVVGMHTSAVRQRLLAPLRARLPYVYTPLYEGGERTPGVYAIGETPNQQLRPAIRVLSARYRVRRWALVGNDYVWPRISHALARGYISEAGGQVVDELYLPLGTTDFGPALQRLGRFGVDALLLSLAGQDAVAFNREFGAAGARLRGMLRLSCAIEENGLLAMGAENTDGLFAAAGYFSGVQTDANAAFKERYYNLFGERAPTLNALGQSTYEGVQFLAALTERRLRRKGSAHAGAPLRYRSAREALYFHNERKVFPMYLAAADGHILRVLERL